MPKPSKKLTQEQRDERIRHHCEEASTHLAALKQLHPKGEKFYTRIGNILKTIHTQHGGIPHD